MEGVRVKAFLVSRMQDLNAENETLNCMLGMASKEYTRSAPQACSDDEVFAPVNGTMSLGQEFEMDSKFSHLFFQLPVH